MKNDPYQSDVDFCPTCADFRMPDDVWFIEVVEELGGVLRYHCKICQSHFEMLPTGPPLPRTPPRKSSPE